jgi:hypothetical protein
VSTTQHKKAQPHKCFKLSSKSNFTDARSQPSVSVSQFTPPILRQFQFHFSLHSLLLLLFVHRKAPNFKTKIAKYWNSLRKWDLANNSQCWTAGPAGGPVVRGPWTADGPTRRCFLQSCSFQISSSLEPSVFWSYVFLFFSLRVECENEVEWNLSYWKVNFASFFFFPCAVYFLIFWLILPGWVAVLRRICYFAIAIFFFLLNLLRLLWICRVLYIYILKKNKEKKLYL